MISKKLSNPFLHFTLDSPTPVTREEAIQLQEQEGYLYMGYGFYGFTCTKMADKEGKEYYHVSWQCSASCD